MQKNNLLEVINKSPAELKRVALNKAAQKSPRLKLKISKGSFKKLKKFHKEKSDKLKKLVTDLFTDITTKGLTMVDEGTVELFEIADKNWRSFIRYKINKLKLHSKEGRVELFEEFSETVNKMLNEKPTTKADASILNEPLSVAIIGLALRLGASKNDVLLDRPSDYKVLITQLKKFIPRGKKGKFEVEAKGLLAQDKKINPSV